MREERVLLIIVSVFCLLSIISIIFFIYRENIGINNEENIIKYISFGLLGTTVILYFWWFLSYRKFHNIISMAIMGILLLISLGITILFYYIDDLGINKSKDNYEKGFKYTSLVLLGLVTLYSFIMIFIPPLTNIQRVARGILKQAPINPDTEDEIEIEKIKNMQINAIGDKLKILSEIYQEKKEKKEKYFNHTYENIINGNGNTLGLINKKMLTIDAYRVGEYLGDNKNIISDYGRDFLIKCSATQPYNIQALYDLFGIFKFDQESHHSLEIKEKEVPDDIKCFQTKVNQSQNLESINAWMRKINMYQEDIDRKINIDMEYKRTQGSIKKLPKLQNETPQEHAERLERLERYRNQFESDRPTSGTYDKNLVSRPGAYGRTVYHEPESVIASAIYE